MRRPTSGDRPAESGGAPAFATVAEADRAGVPPGADALRALLAAHAPVVVLIDEWVTYARLQWGKDDLPGGSFDAALSFAQQLTGAVDQVPGALLVISLPSSAIEVGGEGGQKTLESLKHVVHRVDAPWRPAAAQESFEIVRRRLFEPLTTEAMQGRDEVVQRFGELYAANQGSFPAETKEKAYLGHDPGIVLLFRATRAIDLGAVPGPTQDVPAVPVPGGQHLLLSVAT